MNEEQLKTKILELSGSDNLKAISVIIQYVGWAVANHPMEVLKATYGDGHDQGYYNEKIKMSNNNFIGWWCELSTNGRMRAIRWAITHYTETGL